MTSRCRSNLGRWLGLVTACALGLACSDQPDPGSGSHGGGSDTGDSTGGAATQVDPGGADDTGTGGGTGGGDTTDGLDVGEGCPAVFNPDQVLDFFITLDPADWQAIQGDLTYSLYFPATFQCEDEPPLTVAVRRKRSGGTQKVGLKVDINREVPGQEFQGLKKLNLENGISSGDDGPSSIASLVEEFLGWRLMVLSEAMTSRAAFVHLHVNDQSYGVYVNVEQVDKTFLSARLGHDSGWLWKKSGGDGDGLKTNEGTEDPFAAYFCFWAGGGGACPVPPQEELVATLPEHLDIPQLLRMGAVNALMANTDSPLLKDNNYYYYDHEGGRVYFPWDLDTTMRDDYDVFTGTVGGSTEMYREVLFPGWEADYDALLTDLLAGPLSMDAIDAELDRIVEVGGSSLDADPWVEPGSTAEVVDDLRGWWAQRHPQVQAQVDAHP